jgi:hypothetical protein
MFSSPGKIAVLACLILIIGLEAVADDNILSKEELADGWKLLFNGSDMSQWRNFKKDKIHKKWIVRDRAMVLTKKGGGDLISKQKYRDFDLKLDWKISEAGNSGVFILADEDARIIYLHAPEIQLLDNKRHRDNKEQDHLSGSLYDMIASPAESHKEAGEWNQLRIRIQNKHLKVWQNEVVTADIIIGSEQWKALIANSKFKKWEGFGENEEGYIGFQDHGDEVSFKNIKIKSLD